MQLGRSKLSRILGFLVQESHQGLIGADILAEAPARSSLEHGRLFNRRRRHHGRRRKGFFRKLGESLAKPFIKAGKKVKGAVGKVGDAFKKIFGKKRWQWRRVEQLIPSGKVETQQNALGCMSFDELTITGEMKVSKMTRTRKRTTQEKDCIITGINAGIALDSVNSKVDFLWPRDSHDQRVHLKGTIDISGCIILENIAITKSKLTIKSDTSVESGCLVGGNSAFLALTSRLTFHAVRLQGNIVISGCATLQDLIFEGTSHITYTQSVCVIHGNHAAVAFATDTSQVMLSPGVKLTGRVNIYGCIELQDLQIRTGTLTLKKHASPEFRCVVSGTASIALTSNLQILAVTFGAEVVIVGCVGFQELTITDGSMNLETATTGCAIYGKNASVAFATEKSQVVFLPGMKLTGRVNIYGCIELQDLQIRTGTLTLKKHASPEFRCVVSGTASIALTSNLQIPAVTFGAEVVIVGCVGFQELTITDGSMNLEAATTGCAIYGKNASVAFATEKSQVVFLPGMKLTGRVNIYGCIELQDLQIRTGTLTLKKHASPEFRCVVSGTASIALTSNLQILAVTFGAEVVIVGCVGFQELTITDGSIHIEPAQSDCVIHGNGATMAFATDTSQLMLFPAVKLTGRVNIYGCIELQDLQIRTGTLTVKQDASPESPCVVNGVDASIAFASDFQFPAVKLEGAVEISDCVVFRDLTITSGSITVKKDLSETGDCVIEADDASVELTSRLTFPSTSIRLEGTLEITGCIRLQDILITPGGITFSNDASGNTGCVVHAHDNVSLELTSDNSRVSFFSATLDGTIDIPECVILQDLTIAAGSVELKRDASAKFLCVVSGKDASVAVNSQLVLPSVKLEGTVDIVGCVILQELAIAGSLTLKKDPTSTFRCLVTGTNASIALTSQVKFRSVQFDGIIVISGCDILQDLSIRQGEVTLMSSNIGCEVLGQGAVIEFTRSFRVQNLRLSGGIDFTSCGSFYNLKITRVTFTKGGAGNYGCVVEGEDASVVALPDTSRVDFEKVELRGSLDFSTCVSAKDIKIHEARVVFQGCDRQSCMKITGDFSQEGGSTSFRQCRHGGMNASGSVMLQNSAAMMFDRCGSTRSQGGALHTTGARLRLGCC